MFCIENKVKIGSECGWSGSSSSFNGETSILINVAKAPHVVHMKLFTNIFGEALKAKHIPMVLLLCKNSMEASCAFCSLRIAFCWTKV